MKKELFIFGTRPEIIKCAPLLKKINVISIHTGQHSDLAVEALKIFNIEPDYNLQLMTENQTQAEFISKCIISLEKIIRKVKPTRIWVQGDTSTAFCGAFCAFQMNIPLVHLEAGLRTGDFKNPYPEEFYRKTIDSMASICFAPTQKNVRNLKMENVKGRIHCVGNTVVDALEMIKPQLPKERPIKEKYVLMTMHRRESFEKDIYTTLKVIKKLSKNIKVVFPAHPNPNVQKAVKKTKIKTIEPLNYLDFLWYLRDCEYAISDSGGLQEECPSFNKPLLILRKSTERQEILKTGMAFLSDLTEDDLNLKIKKVQKLVDKKYRKNPFGTGKTSDKIIKIINEK